MQVLFRRKAFSIHYGCVYVGMKYVCRIMSEILLCLYNCILPEKAKCWEHYFATGDIATLRARVRVSVMSDMSSAVGSIPIQEYGRTS